MNEETEWYIRIVYEAIHPESMYGVILQTLWNKYGLMLTNNCPLLQLAMKLQGLVLLSFSHWNPTASSRFSDWISQFAKGLQSAQKNMRIDESHLMALFIVFGIYGHSKSLPPPANYFGTIAYVRAFVKIMTYLNSSVGSSEQSMCYPLWSWLLSGVLQWLNGLSAFDWGRNGKRIDLLWNALSLLRKLRSSLDNSFPDSLHEYRFDYKCTYILVSLRTSLLVFLKPELTDVEITEQQRLEIVNLVSSLGKQIQKLTQSKEVKEIRLKMV